MDIAGVATPAPSQLWQGFQSKAPSVRCYRPPFQSKGRPVERGMEQGNPFKAVSKGQWEPPLFNRGLSLKGQWWSMFPSKAQPLNGNPFKATAPLPS